MESVLENIVPQAGSLNNEENPAIDSNRMKASVVDAGSTDFEGSQKHDMANQTGAGRVVRLVLTASQKTSDEKGGGNKASAVQGGSGETGSGGSRDTDQSGIRTKIERMEEAIEHLIQILDDKKKRTEEVPGSRLRGRSGKKKKPSQTAEKQHATKGISYQCQ